MATFNFKGMDEYVRMLESLNQNTDEMIGKVVYKGAKVVADEMKNAIESIPVDDRRKVDMRSGITSIQKAGLINSFGVAPLRTDKNFINVKLGFDGYNAIGQPNAMIARSVESGTSFMPKFQTFTKAANNAKKACEETMKIEFDDLIYSIRKD